MAEPQPAIKLGTSLTRRFGQVVEKYEKLIQLGQSDVPLYHNLADCYIKLGRFSANEEKVLQKVLDLEPDNQEVIGFLLQNYLQHARRDPSNSRS